MDTQSYEGLDLAAPKSVIKTIWGGYGRAVVGSFVVVMLGLFILFISLMAVSDPARAATPIKPVVVTVSVTPVPTTAATGSAVARVEYPLPYPGLLPDSPLYRLKAARDRVVLLFISDPQKKADKELLFADKRINAAVTLVEGGKEDLGVTTATKAEKYLEQAANRIIQEQKADKDVKTKLIKLRDASVKHIELLSMLEAKVNGDNKTIVAKTGKNTRMVKENLEQAIRE